MEKNDSNEIISEDHLLYVVKKTGLDKDIVLKVLMADNDYLDIVCGLMNKEGDS